MQDIGKADGHCYEDSMNLMVELGSDTDAILVHGLPMGRGPIEGIRHGHAWVEINGIVIDPSYNIVMPAEEYYEMGDIEYTVEYTWREMAEKIVEYGTCGPWEEEFDKYAKRALELFSVPPRKDDSFETCMDTMFNKGEETDAVLVHGIVNGRGEMEGKSYFHAWIEEDGMAIDPMYDVEMPIREYYDEAGLKRCWRYSYTGMCERALGYDTYGPWEPELKKYVKETRMERKADYGSFFGFDEWVDDGIHYWQYDLARDGSSELLLWCDAETESPCRWAFNVDGVNEDSGVSANPDEAFADALSSFPQSLRREVAKIYKHNALMSDGWGEAYHEHKRFRASKRAQIWDNSEDELWTEMSVGDHFTMGNWGEPIEWRVLEVEGDRALVISEKGLDCKPFNEDYRQGNGWSTSDLRAWLNGSFKGSAFSAEQQARIAEVTCLSVDEVKQYFSGNEDRICYPTAYAEAWGVYASSFGACGWWLRSPGSSGSEYAAVVNNVGSVYTYGSSVDYGSYAVRPALRLSLYDKKASKKQATRTFTYAEQKELEDEVIDKPWLNNADRLKDPDILLSF